MIVTSRQTYQGDFSEWIEIHTHAGAWWALDTKYFGPSVASNEYDSQEALIWALEDGTISWE